MNKKRWILFWLCVAVAAVCFGYIAYHYATARDNSDVYDTMREEVSQSIENTTPEPEPAAEDTSDSVEIPIDFSSLQAENPDIYAWLLLPGTDISYPVVQHPTDNSYYLNYTIDNVYGYPGSIYTENYNSKNFTDFNTVIYGHNMNNGSMFGTLDKYKDNEYFQQNNQLIIYTPDKQYTYRIFAAVSYNDRHLLVTFDTAGAEGRQEFLDSIYSCNGINDQIDTGVPVDANSKLITLSTCLNTKSDGRYLIEAVLTNEQSAKQ